MKKIFFILFLFIYNTLIFSQTDLLENILKEAERTYKNLNSYSAELTKIELIGKTIRTQRSIIYRFRKPETIYIRLTEGKEKDTEAIWDPLSFGQNMYIKKPVGNSHLKLKMNPYFLVNIGQERHTLKESDIKYIILLVDDNLKLHQKTKEGKIIYEGEKIFDNCKVKVFKAEFPKNKGFYAGYITLFFDSETSLPIRVEVYGFENEFWETYEYRKLKINPIFKNSDFEFKN